MLLKVLITLILSLNCIMGLQSVQAVMQQETSVTEPILFLPPHKPVAVHWNTQPTRTNMGSIPHDNCYDGQYRGILQRMPQDPQTPYFAEYDWTPKTKGRYGLFVATTLQGVAFTSPVQYRINDQALTALPKPAAGTPKWGPSNAMSWTCVGIYDLAANEPLTLHLESAKRRSMDDYMAMYVNGFFVIDMDAPTQQLHIQHADFNVQTIHAGETLTATLTAAQPVSTGLRCVLTRRHETVLEVIATPDPNKPTQVIATWQLPFDLPTGDYDLQVLPQFSQKIQLDHIPTVHLIGMDMPASSASDLAIKQINWLNDSQQQLQVQLNKPAQADTMIGLWLLDDNDLLMAACNLAAVVNQTQFNLTLPNDPRWQQASRGTLHAFVHQSTQATNATLACIAKGKTPLTFKPMSHGIYQTESDMQQYWYVRDDHTMIWNGKPWIPVGGMYCSPVLTYPSNLESVRKKQWQTNSQSLDAGLQSGLQCLYVNLGHGSQWLKQSVINDLNQRNIPYGWQLGFRQPTPVYPIRSRKDQGLIHGTCDVQGTLIIALPRHSISEVLLVGPMTDPKIHIIPLKMNLDAGEKPDFIQLDLTEDSASGKLTTVRLEQQKLPEGQYYALAQTTRKEHFTNLWDGMADFQTYYQWLKQINWGPNLRLFIDPSGNEEGLFNESESVRVHSTNFENWYADWLKARYQDLDQLCDAWSLPTKSLDDWNQAARLLPIRDLEIETFKQHVWWIDPQTQKLFVTTDDLGQGWDDYTLAVRVSYAQLRDELAKQIKQIVNVPIVFKRVSPWVNIETINTTPGGFDGVGLELYPAWGSIVSPGLATGAAEARMASQTMWLLGTEMGYSAARGNKGVKGWPTRDYLQNFITTTASFGAKGFFFFGWRLEPGNLWGNSNLDGLPEQVQWITDCMQSLQSNWPEPVSLAQAYPQGHAWYFRVAGKPLTRDTAMYPEASSSIIQSILLERDPDRWAVSCNVPLPDADPIVVNFQDAHAVARFAPQVSQWLKQGKHVIYVGLWPSAKPFATNLTPHFDLTVKTDQQGNYQTLRLKSDDTVVAKDSEGKAWAKLSGRLLIIARPIAPKANQDVVPEPIRSEWVKQLMSR